MNEKRLPAFTSILRGLLALATVYAIIIAFLWFVKGSVWFNNNVLPVNKFIFFFLVTMTFFIVVPSAVITATRPYAGLILYWLTFIFGGIVWFYAAFYCLNVMNTFWFIFGLLFGFIGVVPVALIGALVKGQRSISEFMVLQLLATIGCRVLATIALPKVE